MSVEFPQQTSSSLVERAKNILVRPKEEWARIDAEPATVAGIFTSYVVPLAAIGPIAHVIGMLVFGVRFFGIVYRPGVAYVVSSAIASCLAALIGTYVFALILNALAPNFGGVKSEVQAMKVSAYSSTAAWLAGIFQIVPALAWLAILGLYSLYLLWIGAPRLMKVPADKAAGYTIVSIIVAIVVFFVLAMIAGSIATMFAPSMTIPTGTLSVG